MNEEQIEKIVKTQISNIAKDKTHYPTKSRKESIYDAIISSIIASVIFTIVIFVGREFWELRSNFKKQEILNNELLVFRDNINHKLAELSVFRKDANKQLSALTELQKDIQIAKSNISKTSESTDLKSKLDGMRNKSSSILDIPEKGKPGSANADNFEKLTKESLEKIRNEQQEQYQQQQQMQFQY